MDGLGNWRAGVRSGSRATAFPFIFSPTSSRGARRAKGGRGRAAPAPAGGGVMFYGAVVWDPLLIVCQIVCLQCLYYLVLGLIMSVLVGTRVSRISLFYLFDYSALTVSTVTGWCVTVSFFLSALAGAGILFQLIERAKKCLDFTATLYIIHLFICIKYGGWPASITWWVVNGSSLAIMALLGEWLCIRRESREIPIPRLRSNV